VPDYEAPETEHVQIVVLDTLMRRKGFMNQAGPHPRHFVRDNRCPDTTSTDGHAAIHLPASDGAGQGNNLVRIIIVWCQAAIAEVDHDVTCLLQHRDQVVLQLEPAMVGGNPNVFGRPWPL
jgi:hypothetical protein